jgi:CDP-glucose 4,6-dehydratase
VNPSPFSGLYRGKSVFVTGHTGFKGAWLAEWLLCLGARVHGFALVPSTQPAIFEQLGLASRLHHEIGDIRDPVAVKQSILAAQPDFVFHLAAQPLVRRSYEQPVETYATNVMGTINVLQALRELRKPCPAVMVTTDKCYENREWVYGYREEDPLGGHDPYSSSKAAAEIAIGAWRRSFFQNHPVKIASARAGNVIGGGDWAQDRILPDCIRSLQTSQPIAVRNPKATRPWQHVLEPLSGYLWLAALLYDQRSETRGQKSEVRSQRSEVGDQRSEISDPKPAPSSILRPPSSVLCPLPSVLCPPSSVLCPLDSPFNFGPSHESNRTVEELVAEVLKHWPGQWEDQSDPKAPHEAGLLQLSTDKAHALLRWSPVWSFSTAIEQTVNWYREARKAPEQAPDLTRRQIQRYQADAAKAQVPWARGRILLVPPPAPSPLPSPPRRGRGGSPRIADDPPSPPPRGRG